MAIMADWTTHDPPQPDARPFGGKMLCAHADQNGEGMHWLQPGERCRHVEPDDEPIEEG